MTRSVGNLRGADNSIRMILSSNNLGRWWLGQFRLFPGARGEMESVFRKYQKTGLAPDFSRFGPGEREAAQVIWEELKAANDSSE